MSRVFSAGCEFLDLRSGAETTARKWIHNPKNGQETRSHLRKIQITGTIGTDIQNVRITR